jgi:signal transduction histidine kinase
MNSYATLTIIYVLITLISSGILYGSFRNKNDASAIYFLISELCMTVACGILFLFNLNIISQTPLMTGIVNFCTIGAEISLLFSLLSLTRKIEKKWLVIAIFLDILFVTFIELIRGDVGLRNVVLLLSIFSLPIIVINYLICKTYLPRQIVNNQFVKWLTLFELGMIGYGTLRLLAYFAPMPATPRETPNDIAVIIYSIYVVLGTFRFIAYLSLRITWVDQKSPSNNLLNQTLAKELEEKSQLVRKLMASSKAIGISALASSLAHQLSQPLTAIALMAETAKRDAEQTGKNIQLSCTLEEISTQSIKLAKLVKSLRQLFSTTTHPFVPLNLRKIADELIDIIEPSLKTKKISLIKDFKSDPLICGDALQLQQVLINVFNNAVDILILNEAEKKNIYFSISNNENYAIIEIRDSGVGISPSLLPNIFELYKTTKQNGIGVGLWLSKTIIEHHHGNITAINEPNHGALLKIEIPLYTPLASI